MKSFLKLHLKSVVFASALVLTLSACNNPLGGDLKQSKFDDAHQPGLPNQNVAPVASNSNLTVLKNIVKSETLSGSDANSGDTLSFSVVAQGTKGVVAVTNAATGAFTYTPNNNVIGSDSFTFKVNDGKLDSNTATVTVTIYDPNIAPVASAISPAAFNEDIQSAVMTLSYTDADGDLATACTISNLSNVTVTQACACDVAGVCTLRVTGTANYFGAATFDYTVTANGQDSNTASATLSITAVNDAPTMTAISAQSTNEDVAKAVTFTIADAETAITCGASVSMSSTNTTLVPNVNVVWSGTAPACTGTVTPAANQYGTSDLTFTVTDGTLTAARTFTLTVSQLGDDSFNGTVLGDYWPFDALSTALYSFSSSVIQFSGGIAELIGTLQTDSEATENTDNTFTVGTTMNGVVYDTLTVGPTKGLKLGNSGSCNGGTSDCAKQDAAEIYELHESWTPKWASLLSYWKMNGSGSITGTAAADNIPATVGTAGSSSNANNSGMAYTVAKLNEGITFDGVDDYFTSTSVNTSKFSISAWVKASGVVNGKYPIIVSLPGSTLYFGVDNSAPSNRYTVKFLSDRTTDGVWHSPSDSIAQDLWFHIAVTYDSSSTSNDPSIYINGLAATVTEQIAPVGTQISNAGTVYIGNRSLADRPWKGTIDELAIWSEVLTSSQITTLYSSQSAQYSGTFTSRVMDAKSSSSWTTLSWIPTLPFYKDLPDAACAGASCTHVNYESNNSTTGYSSIYDNGLTNKLMDGIVGLWHLNETSATVGASNDFKDDSGRGNHGEMVGTLTFGANGKLDKSVLLAGDSGYVTLGNTNLPTGASPRTLSVWFKFTTTPSASTEIFGYGANSIGQRFGVWYDSSQKLGIETVNYGRLFSWIPDNHWHHFVAIFPAGQTSTDQLILYFDGQLMTTSNLGTPQTMNTTNANPQLGRLNAANGYGFTGNVDELAIWNRALHANEIKQLYQRGASRLKYQVRSCNDNACSGETWQGPDGTSGTYFSELLNKDNVTDANSDGSINYLDYLTSSGDVKAAPPSMLFSSFTASPPGDNQYFQYRTILESDSSTAALQPELKSTTVDPIHYPKYLSTDTSPLNTIIGQNGVAFYDLNNFAQSLGAGSCSNGVVYNLGLSNTGPWKYWTGAAWATADGSSAQANTAAALVASSNAALTAFATDVGRGSVFFKAFMTSTGTSKCELDNILVGGNK